MMKVLLVNILLALVFVVWQGEGAFLARMKKQCGCANYGLNRELSVIYNELLLLQLLAYLMLQYLV